MNRITIINKLENRNNDVNSVNRKLKLSFAYRR